MILLFSVKNRHFYLCPAQTPVPDLALQKNAVLCRAHSLSQRLYEPQAKAGLSITSKEGNFSTIELYFASGETQDTDEFYEMEYRAKSKVQFYREEYPDGNTKYTRIEYDEFGGPTVDEISLHFATGKGIE